MIGAAYGIGRLAGCALESMARQPEVAGSIQTAMIIAAALIEGFTFFALFICMTTDVLSSFRIAVPSVRSDESRTVPIRVLLAC